MRIINLLVQLLLLLVAASAAELFEPLTRVGDHVTGASILSSFLKVETNPCALAHREVVGHGCSVQYRLARLRFHAFIDDRGWLVVSTDSLDVTVLADLQSYVPDVDGRVVGIATDLVAYSDQ